MRNPNNGQYSIGRILLISPNSNEMLRRNYSRIFIAPIGEGVIDSILFQGYRPVESFMDIAARAIQMSGLNPATGDLTLRPMSNPYMVNTFAQQHLATVGWLEGEDSTVYDMWIEVIPANETLPEINMTTYNANEVEGFEHESPLVIAVGVEDLNPEYLNDDLEETHSETTSSQNTNESSNTNQDQSASVEGQSGSGRGRVTDPANDRRLKANRDNSSAMARRDEAEHSETSGRMAGRPGRVKDPRLDFRLKANRPSPQGADAGGR